MHMREGEIMLCYDSCFSEETWLLGRNGKRKGNAKGASSVFYMGIY